MAPRQTKPPAAGKPTRPKTSPPAAPPLRGKGSNARASKLTVPRVAAELARDNSPLVMPPDSEETPLARRAKGGRRKQASGPAEELPPAPAQPEPDPDMPPRQVRKSSKAEVERRLSEVEKELARGKHPASIIRRITAKYKVTDRQAENYLSTVYKRWKRIAAENSPHFREQWMMMAYSAFQGALLERDYKAAASILKEIADRNGLDGNSQLGDPFSAVPDDGGRFPGDKNFQIMKTMRDRLAARGAAGDPKAAEAAAKVSLDMYDAYGINRSVVTSEEEQRAIAAAKAKLVTAGYVGAARPQPITEPLDDFAGLRPIPDAKKKPEPS